MFTDETASTILVKVEDEPTEIKAVYQEIILMYELVVENGSGSGDYLEGAEVTIIADEAAVGQEFKSWDVVSGDVVIDDKNNTEIVVIIGVQDVEIKANYGNIIIEEGVFELVVSNGSGSGEYKEGVEVAIVADLIDSKFDFVRWEIIYGQADIIDSSAVATTLIIGTESTGIKPIYVEKETNELLVSAGSGGGSYFTGNEVLIVANTPPDNMFFSHWEVSFGDATILDFNNASTTLTMGEKDAVVKAKFENFSDTDSLAFISHTVSSSMISGREVEASLSLKNVGVITWTASDNYTLLLSAVDELSDFNPVSVVLEETEVAPGEIAVFNFNITAPQIEGDYKLNWQLTNDKGLVPSILLNNILVTVKHGYLDDCDESSGWATTGTNSIRLVATNKEGTGSIEFKGSESNDVSKFFPAAYDANTNYSQGVLEFWYYISDISLIDNINVQVGSGSGGFRSK